MSSKITIQGSRQFYLWQPKADVYLDNEQIGQVALTEMSTFIISSGKHALHLTWGALGSFRSSNIIEFIIGDGENITINFTVNRFSGIPILEMLNGVNSGTTKYYADQTQKTSQTYRAIKNEQATDNIKPLEIFLCHSSNDKPKVRELHRRLYKDGFKPWLDEENLLPGQDWQLEIPKAVRRSDVVIVCLSKGSITKSGYIQKEIRQALDVADEKPEGTVFIIPLKLEECDVPERLSRWQWVNFFDDKGYQRLTMSLNIRAQTKNGG